MPGGHVLLIDAALADAFAAEWSEWAVTVSRTELEAIFAKLSRWGS